MNCELIDNRCNVCGWEVPAKLRGRRIFRPCGIRETVKVEPVQRPERTACIHRGESLRVEKCKPCQSGGITPEIFACSIHGECTLYTISKRKPDGSRWPACSTCEQRGA